MTDIAVIGAGNVGQALARNFAAQGRRVRLGARDPARQAALAADLPAGLTVEPLAAAIAPAALVLLATPYEAALEVAAQRPDWGGRILVDATNPILPGLRGLRIGTDTSGAEQIARRAAGARVVKAFNTTGFENLGHPQHAAGRLFMPVAGDDADARAEVLALATAIGFDAVDLGGLAAARYIEPLAMVWIEMALRLGHGRRFGFVRVRGDNS